MNDHVTAATAVVALGSNIGDKRANIARAVELLSDSADIRLSARSRDYRTPPWGNTDQDWFVNAAILVETTLSPRDLLRRCLAIEESMGRRRAEKWGPRVIDLDVLVYGDVAMKDDELELPHPHITKRAFVLAPMADVAPDVMLDGRTVADWLADHDLTGIEPFEDG